MIVGITKLVLVMLRRCHFSKNSSILNGLFQVPLEKDFVNMTFIFISVFSYGVLLYVATKQLKHMEPVF